MNKHEQASMAGLVVIDDGGELRASSLAIAARSGVKHKNVLDLVKTYEGSLAEFGRVAFETLPFDTAGGRQMRQVAMLNEHQSTLLVTMMRNAPQVVAMKIALVKEFYRMRNELSRRERGLWMQMQDLIAKEVNSQVRASFGAHLMLDRKRELPALRDERAMLEAAIQPSLLN